MSPIRRTVAAAVGCCAALALVATVSAASEHTDVAVTASGPDGSDVQPGFPLRAAFYYPWFPETWRDRADPYTRYRPSLGLYSSSDMDIVRRHIRAMEYGRIEAGIASWWGRGHRTDRRLPTLLSAVRTGRFRWAVYYETEGTRDPDVAEIGADLRYLRDRFGRHPAYLRIRDRFVVFVYNANDGDCSVVRRWNRANQGIGAYLVMKVFEGWKSCRPQPDGWHQYGPASAAQSHPPWSFAISPGFWAADEDQPRLPRNHERWLADVRRMVASGARFQLVTTFNEWGEGTAVESANPWETPSGFGAYLDALNQASAPARGKQTIRSASSAKRTHPVIAAAGDIADDDFDAEKTAQLLDQLRPDVVLALGDMAYEQGTSDDYRAYYEPTWGRHKAITRPTPGNHEYLTPGAAGYFAYFGAAAGDPTKGYYSFDVGRWHIIALNSTCTAAGGCGLGSPQERWLRRDLNAHRTTCTLAFWHHPRFSSGKYENDATYQSFWKTLHEYGADVVLNGHDHNYQRYAPQNPKGRRDERRGLRQFVVGTGGKNTRDVDPPPIRNRDVADGRTFGVLALTLLPASYKWRFVPVAGSNFTDAGSGRCH